MTVAYDSKIFFLDELRASKLISLRNALFEKLRAGVSRIDTQDRRTNVRLSGPSNPKDSDLENSLQQ